MLHRSVIRFFVISAIIVTSVFNATVLADESSAKEAFQTIKLLPPGPGNPRNSEGDFIKLADGRLLFVYTHFDGENGNDHATAYLAGRFSSDGGKTWTNEDTLVIPNDAKLNIMSVSLLRLQDGRIALFYMRKDSLTDCRPVMRTSSDEGKTWSEATQIIPGSEVSYYVLNNDRVVQLKNGRLIVPVARHYDTKKKKHDWAGVVRCYLSDDAGKTWQGSKTSLLTKANGKRIITQEPGVIELKDGRLMMWVRTNGGSQYVSYSSDDGDTWSNFKPSSMISPRSPATIERIPGTDTLLLAWNSHENITPELRHMRTPYSIAISDDEGKTWKNVQNLYNDPYGWYCYTGMHFEGDHVLLAHCAGDRRKGGLNETHITRIPLEWITQTTAIAAEDFQKTPAKLYELRKGLPNFFAKLDAGKATRIAYLGGSITAQNGWRPKTLRWFQKKYPNAKVSQIHAAIGGTGSDLGVFRVYQDALQHKPDLLFIEFAVNDGSALPERIYKAMEGIVRQTWQHDPTTDICFVYTIHKGMLKGYQDGTFSRSASAMEQIADHYGIPSICMALRVAELEKEGKLIFTGDPGDPAHAGKIIFSKDSCHPTDAGHNVFLEVISEAMEKMAPTDTPPLGTVGPHELKTPFREDNWEQAKMVPITKDMLSGSWRQMEPNEKLVKRFGKRLPKIWLGSTPGDTLTFKFRGTMARLYDLLGPDGGQYLVTIDGEPKSKPCPRFDSHCTYYRLGGVTLCQNLEPKEHTVSIKILEKQPDREVVLKRVRDKPNFNPDRYNGTNVWAGYLLIVGDIVSPK